MMPKLLWQRFIVNHRLSPVTAYHSHCISNIFGEKMLEIRAGFSVESRLWEVSEKRGRAGSKVGKKSGACRVGKCPEKEGKWRDTLHERSSFCVLKSFVHAKLL